MRVTPGTIRRQLSTALLCMGLACVSAFAQPTKPTTSVRNSLVTALNNFLTANAGVASGTVPFSFSNAGLYLDDALAGCGVINPLDISVNFDGPRFTLNRTVRPGGTLS